MIVVFDLFMKRTKQSVAVIYFVIFCGISSAIAQTNTQTPKWALDALMRARANERPIIFYGKVVDQFGSPVQGAEIQATIQQAGILYVPSSPEPCINVKTDTDGKFELTGSIKGTDLIIDKISKDGFESTRPIGKNSYAYAEGSPSKYVPDKSKPVIFQLRKKLLSEVFLLKNPSFKMSLVASWSGKPLGYDLIRRWPVADLRVPMLDYRPLCVDFLMTATQNTNAGQWTVTFSAGHTNGGIMVTNQLFHEAPEGGYQPECTLNLTNNFRNDKVLRLYLKSREPAIYTRIDLEYIHATLEEFRVEGETWTNPYGGRDMEEASDLPSALYVRLMNEAEDAFRLGNRPAQPDLPKLIQEAKTNGN